MAAVVRTMAAPGFRSRKLGMLMIIVSELYNCYNGLVSDAICIQYHIVVRKEAGIVSRTHGLPRLWQVIAISA